MRTFLKVVSRELLYIKRNHATLFGSIGVVLFSCLFLLTFFRDGLPHDLPIAVVDLDNTSLSRNFCRQLDATQLGEVVKYDDYQSAREAMQTGKVTSVIVIPEGMAEDVYAYRRPSISYYVNSLYFIGGALSYKDILTMLTMTGGAVQREVLRAKGYSEDAIMGMIQPIVVDEHRIGNATMNYGAYLNNILLPGFLGLSIIMLIVYVLCSEIKYGTNKEWLDTAGGSFGIALAGKLAPYTVIYLILGMIMDILMYGVCKYPLAGSIIWLMFGKLFYIMACEAMALVIFGFLPKMRFAMSLAAVFSVLSLSISGFTMPVSAMPGAIQGLSVLFPLRAYYKFYVQEVIFGSGFTAWWPYIIWMLAFVIFAFAMSRRIRNSVLYQDDTL